MGTSSANDFLRELTVDEVLRRWPALYSVFLAEGMGACLGCAVAPFETVMEASAACRVDREHFISALVGAMGTAP